MSQDLASLYIKVDSTGVVTSSRHLEELEGKARKVETATQSVTASFMKMAAAMGVGMSASQLFNTIVEKSIAIYRQAFKAVDDYRLSVASLAAMVMTFQEKQKNADPSAQWKEALKYSSAMVPILENIAAKTLLSGQETIALANAFARSGIFLDANNKKQIEGFTALSNAIPLLTQGQAIMLQINQEIRGLMGGGNIANSMLLQTLKAIDPEIKKHLDTWRTQGTVIEHIGTLLAGFIPATKLLENQWQAVKSTIDTTVTQLLRGAMSPFYDDIIQSTKDLNDWLAKNKETIIDWGTKFKIILIDVQAEIMRMAMFLDKIGGTLTSAQMLLYGPGRALGVESSTKRFEQAADANIEYEKRYKETEKSLEALAIKQIKLEETLTEAYKKRTKEQEKTAAPKGGKTLTDDEIEKMEKLIEKWKKYKDVLDKENKLSGLTGLSKDLMENQIKAEQALKEYDKLPPALKKAAQEEIKKNKAIADATARKKEETQAEKDYLELLEEEKKLRDSRIEFYSDIEGYELKAYELKLQRIEEERQAYIKLYGDIEAANAWASQAQFKAIEERINAEQKGARTVISNFDKMLDAAMECYNEDSKEYKRLQDFKKVALAAELAMEIEKNIKIIAGYGAQATAAVGAAGTTNAANASTAVTGAVASVTGQGTGDPYTAFPRIAAMIALMTAVLGIAGIAFGGGGSSVSPSSTTPAMGNSTVLGAEYGTGSESVKNSLDLLQATYDLEDTKLTKIYEELRDLNDNISGLVTSILRTGSYDEMSSYSETITSIYNKIADTSALAMSNLIVTFMQGSAGMLYTPWILGQDKLANNITAFLSHSFNDIFGGGQEIWSTGSGISLGKSTVRDILSGSGVLSRAYQDITKRTSTEFWRSDSYDYETIYKALDGDVQRMFSLVYTNIGSTLLELANQFGTNTESALNYAFEEAKINLANMTGEEMNDALQEYFSKIGDTAAEALFGDLISQYQQLNEGLLETAVRLVLDKNSVLSILEYTNQAFDGTTAELIKFSESLITVAGSLENLTDAFDTYYDAFFSDSEKQADREKSLSDAMALYGYSLPGQRSDYRALVEQAGLLQTEQGQATYYALLELSKTADAYYDYIEKLKDSIDESDYATKQDYLRAVAGFADGGISTGPQSGYLATLHGTELVVSPRTGYPATVVGGMDYPELLSEMKDMKRVMSDYLDKIQRNTKDATEIIDKFDRTGIPPERTS